MRAGRGGPRRACALALLLFASLALAAAQPAGAVGPTISVTAGPRNATSTVEPSGVIPAEYTAQVSVFGGSQAPANVLVTITSNFGWAVDPPQVQRSVTGGTAQFSFNFTVSANESAAAGDVSQVTVTAAYRVAGVTLGSEYTVVYTEAGSYYGASVKRTSAPEAMAPGNSYKVSFDVANQGNSLVNVEFHWLDPDLVSRLKADFALPQALSLAGFENRTAVFDIKPQGTTPGGKYDIPVQARVTDRSGETYAVVNFTLSVEFSNLPYPGILPRFDLTGPYTILSFVGLFLFLWLLFNGLVAFFQRGRYRDEGGSPFVRAYVARLKRSLVGSLALRAVGRGRPKRRTGVRRPEDVARARAARARAAAAARPTSRELPARRGPSGKP